ncbi:hypothetical protein [Sideroxydans sp. CL21]|nr:hypothetical protein [Sideroxydans sp. CL21]
MLQERCIIVSWVQECGQSYFDRPVPSRVEGLNANGLINIDSGTIKTFMTFSGK